MVAVPERLMLRQLRQFADFFVIRVEKNSFHWRVLDVGRQSGRFLLVSIRGIIGEGIGLNWFVSWHFLLIETKESIMLARRQVSWRGLLRSWRQRAGSRPGHFLIIIGKIERRKEEFWGNVHIDFLRFVAWGEKVEWRWNENTRTERPWLLGCGVVRGIVEFDGPFREQWREWHVFVFIYERDVGIGATCRWRWRSSSLAAGRETSRSSRRESRWSL